MSAAGEFTEDWLRAYCQRTGVKMPEGVAGNHCQENKPAAKRRNKYGNQQTERDGRLFDSKHEADIYDGLMLRTKAGEIFGVICQHPFRLPGDVVYIADFVTLDRDGTFSVLDAKSDATRKDKAYRLKRRLMEKCLGIRIVEV